MRSFVKTSTERFSSYSHLVGAGLGLIGTIILILLTWASPIRVILSLVYGISTIFLFGASATYHALKIRDDEISLARRIDHIAIFVLIAGTYTPFCYFYLDGVMQIAILSAQWILVGIGLLLKIFVLNTPRWVTAGIYVVMGWMLLIPLPQLIQNVPDIIITLVAIGGVLATLGAIVYARKKPNPQPGVFGFHDIFHLLILIANGFLFAATTISLIS